MTEKRAWIHQHNSLRDKAATLRQEANQYDLIADELKRLGEAERNSQRAGHQEINRSIEPFCVIIPITGNSYILHYKSIELISGNRNIYFFTSSHLRSKSGTPCTKPHGYDVGFNPRTGLPYLYTKPTQELNERLGVENPDDWF